MRLIADMEAEAMRFAERAGGYRMTGDRALAHIMHVAALKLKEAAQAMKYALADEERARNRTEESRP